MSRHDYDLPPDWAAMSAAERDQWLKAERCRRQALSQETPAASRLAEAADRYRRRAEARAGRVDVESHR